MRDGWRSSTHTASCFLTTIIPMAFCPPAGTKTVDDLNAYLAARYSLPPPSSSDCPTPSPGPAAPKVVPPHPSSPPAAPPAKQQKSGTPEAPPCRSPLWLLRAVCLRRSQHLQTSLVPSQGPPYRQRSLRYQGRRWPLGLD